MKNCDKCGVTVAGDLRKCPLCQHTLAGEGQGDVSAYPFIPIIRDKHSLLFRLLQLCSAAVVILSLTVNWMLSESGYWSLFISAGVACIWLSLFIVIRKRHNILKNLTYQVTVVSLLSLLWDVMTGWHGWSIDFVIPIAFITAMSVTPILARIFKMETGTYMVYLFLLILYGIVPAVFVLTGWSDTVYPSMLCVAGSLLSFAGLLIFEGGNMIEELKRRLHL